MTIRRNYIIIINHHILKEVTYPFYSFINPNKVKSLVATVDYTLTSLSLAYSVDLIFPANSITRLGFRLSEHILLRISRLRISYSYSLKSVF